MSHATEVMATAALAHTINSPQSLQFLKKVFPGHQVGAGIEVKGPAIMIRGLEKPGNLTIVFDENKNTLPREIRFEEPIYAGNQRVGQREFQITGSYIYCRTSGERRLIANTYSQEGYWTLKREGENQFLIDANLPYFYKSGPLAPVDSYKNIIISGDTKDAMITLTNENVRALKQNGFDLNLLDVVDVLSNRNGLLDKAKNITPALMGATFGAEFGLMFQHMTEELAVSSPVVQMGEVASVLLFFHSLFGMMRAGLNNTLNTTNSDKWAEVFAIRHRNIGLLAYAALNSMIVQPAAQLRRSIGMKSGK